MSSNALDPTWGHRDCIAERDALKAELALRDQAVQTLGIARENWKSRAAKYRTLLEQFTSKEMYHPDEGYCLFCFGETMHTVGCLWKVVQQALKEQRECFCSNVCNHRYSERCDCCKEAGE
jgi:hypothetical protein